jgi:hypothetical protein
MAAWSGRKLVIDLWLDPRRGASAKFSALAHLQKVYLPVRGTGKRAYLGVADIRARARTMTASWQSVPKRGGKPAANDRTAREFKA